jgi:ketol-acid reductoisomerase
MTFPELIILLNAGCSGNCTQKSINFRENVRTSCVAPRLPGDLEQYSVGQGLNDIVAYYYAGTFVGAIEGIQTDAGNKKKDAEAAAPSAPTATPSPKS